MRPVTIAAAYGRAGGGSNSDTDDGRLDPQGDTPKDYLLVTIAGEHRVAVIDDAAAEAVGTTTDSIVDSFETDIPSVPPR